MRCQRLFTVLLATALAGCALPPPVPAPTPLPRVTWAVAPSDSTPRELTPIMKASPSSPTLPRGGVSWFPAYRLFGYSGQPGAPGQGRLGIGDIEARMTELETQGAAFAGGRRVQPVMELIASVATASPGADGKYRFWIPDTTVDAWLVVARRHRALLLLNIQAGRADFVAELRHFESYLRQPDVGVALDPEWAVDPTQVPGAVFGHTSGAELNDCAVYLAGLVTTNHLPQKVLVYHQLNPGVVRDPAGLRPHPEVAIVRSVDGIGSPGAKVDTWTRLVPDLPAGVHPGFKLFFDEDVARGTRLMTPAEVLALVPQPEYVLFE